MNELTKIFGQQNSIATFDQLRITIASPERIRSWSFGEIKKPETITTEHLSRNAMACSAHVFLVR